MPNCDVLTEICTNAFNGCDRLQYCIIHTNSYNIVRKYFEDIDIPELTLKVVDSET